MMTGVSTSLTVHGTRIAIRITTSLLALMVAAARGTSVDQHHLNCVCAVQGWAFGAL